MVSAIGTVANAAITGVSVVADVAGVPGLGAATTVLGQISAYCAQVVTHKEDCRRLANKAEQLAMALEEQRPKLNESQIRTYTDTVEAALDKVQRRTKRMAKIPRFSAFINDSKIAGGIKYCESELDTAFRIFHMQATIVQTFTMDQVVDWSRHVNDHIIRTEEMIFQLLRNPQTVIELQRRGEPVAERVMEEGQEQLRRMREDQGIRPVSPDAIIDDSAPPAEPVYTSEYLEFQSGLVQIYQSTKIPPAVKVLDGEVKRVGDIPVAGGTYSDVWQGTWLGDQKVALKALRGVRAKYERDTKRLEREISLWSKLSHPNIITFIGVVTDIGNFVHMASPWQENGNIHEYVKKNSHANRLHLLRGAADALAYLHSDSIKIVHGNVKCTNILVSSEGNGLLSDFGMSKVIEDAIEQSASATLTRQGSARWLAPELIEGGIDRPNTACDVYSFSITIVECFTSATPFSHVKRDAQVIHRIVSERLRPPRPDSEYATDDVWDLVERCWSAEPNTRPPMVEVAARLRELDVTHHS